MRFIEQPKFGPTSDQTCKRCAATLTCGKATDRNITQPSIETKTNHRRFDIGKVSASGKRPKSHIVGNTEFVIEAGAMSK
jgi:hypothetical protein